MIMRSILKPCRDCGGSKAAGRGASPYCIACRDKPRLVRKGAQRRYELKSRYGLSKADYDEIFAAQSGVCAICQTLPIEKRRTPGRLDVDHCHQSNHVRGLLCRRCNSGLHFLENVDWRERAEAYLSNRAELILAPQPAPEQEAA